MLKNYIFKQLESIIWHWSKSKNENVELPNMNLVSFWSLGICSLTYFNFFHFSFIKKNFVPINIFAWFVYWKLFCWMQWDNYFPLVSTLMLLILTVLQLCIRYYEYAIYKVIFDMYLTACKVWITTIKIFLHLGLLLSVFYLTYFCRNCISMLNYFINIYEEILGVVSYGCPPRFYAGFILCCSCLFTWNF